MLNGDAGSYPGTVVNLGEDVVDFLLNGLHPKAGHISIVGIAEVVPWIAGFLALLPILSVWSWSYPLGRFLLGNPQQQLLDGKMTILKLKVIVTVENERPLELKGIKKQILYAYSRYSPLIWPEQDRQLGNQLRCSLAPPWVCWIGNAP